MGFTLFDTAIGRCGIAWADDGIVGVQMPESREADTRTRLLRRFPQAIEETPPRDVRVAIDHIVALLFGEARDLSEVRLDMSGVAPFYRRVYAAAREIPPGQTLSYGEVAARLGDKGAARAVGQALGKNPFAIIVPCHRVLAAGGRVGGFSASGGIATKLEMLSIERGAANGNRGLFDGDGVFDFDPKVAIVHLRDVDPVFARTIDTIGPFTMTLKKTPSIFGALAEAIVYQQLSGKAAATIFGRVRALFSRVQEGPSAEQLLRVSDAKLRAAGLSGAKLLSLRDLAARQLQGEIPTLAEAHRLDDETLIERLTEVRGIGRWTVEMLLMFRLARPDVLPAGDYGIRKGFAAAFKKRALPAPDLILKHGARWKPYRTVASWYLWRIAERADAERPKKRQPSKV